MTTRTKVKAGGMLANHSETLRVRSAVKAGGSNLNHNETLRRSEGKAVSMRRRPRTTTSREDRLELLVVRAGLRAGARARARSRR